MFKEKILNSPKYKIGTLVVFKLYSSNVDEPITCVQWEIIAGEWKGEVSSWRYYVKYDIVTFSPHTNTRETRYAIVSESQILFRL